MNESLLRLDSLCFGAAGQALAPAIDLTLSSGELLAVLGPNGAGKTTLFRSMLGLLPAISGAVLWRASPVSAQAGSSLASLVSYVPQSPGAAFDFTVRDYVMMGRLGINGPFGVPSRADRIRVDEAIERLGILPLGNRTLSRLSGGERQLAAIARALAQGCKAMLLDEPAASLDLANQALVLGLLRELARDQMLIVYSTHDPNHALIAATRVLLLAPGKAPRCGAPGDLLDPETLSLAFGLPLEEAQTPAGRRLIGLGLPSADMLGWPRTRW